MEKTCHPLISVILPVYNGDGYVAACLNSVLEQTLKDIEVLVVDDGSRDGTAGIVEEFIRTDPRVCLLQQPNGGVASARNLGLSRARGTYIAPIDADDIWSPIKLEKQITCLEEDDYEAGIAYSWTAWIDEAGNWLGDGCQFEYTGRVFEELIHRNFTGCASVPLIRRKCLEDVGGYATWMRKQGGEGCEDWELLLRLSERYAFAVVPEVLVSYRQVCGSMCRKISNMFRSYQLMMADITARHPELTDTSLSRSKGNFCRYLARLCDRDGQRLTKRLWLWRAQWHDRQTKHCGEDPLLQGECTGDT